MTVRSTTPIFLHSSWRTGSTYLWSKFRALSGTCCFFEPLNEHLSTATAAFIDSFAPWPYANHPNLDAPYLEEFRPLLSVGGGVPLFPAAFTYGRFRADRASALPGLTDYFGRLRRHAEEAGKVPVFGCVRTDLRLDWFRAHLEGVHILIRRNPRRQFLSALNQAVKGNKYFLERGWVILGANREDPAFRPLVALYEVPDFPGADDVRGASYARRAWTAEWIDLYTIACFLHGLAARSARTAMVDLVIDMDELGDDPAAIAAAEHNVAALTGASLSLGDCGIERYDRHLAWSAPFFAEIEAKVVALLRDSDVQVECAAQARIAG